LRERRGGGEYDDRDGDERTRTRDGAHDRSIANF
jgi:hypothetical protein